MTTFISYSRVNSDFALRLAKDLKAVSADIWFDQLDIPTGARWDDEIEKALEKSEAFLIILSPESIQSQNVKDEVGYAIDAGKLILPVVIENCNVPFRLRRFQYVEFTNKPYENSLAEIKHLLTHPENSAVSSDEKKDFIQAKNDKSFQKLVENKKPEKSKHRQTLVLVASIACIALAAIAVYLFMLRMSKSSSNFNNTMVDAKTTQTASALSATPTAKTKSAPTESLSSPSPTASSAYFFQDGCINKSTWTLLQSNTAPENNNCWNLEGKGIFALQGKGLSISVINPPSSRVNGLVTGISSDTDVSFDMEISNLATASDWNTNVAVGLLPSATSTPSQVGTSILFQSGLPNKPIWMMLQMPDTPQKYLPPPRIELNKIYNVKLEIRGGTRLITYLDYEIVDDRNLSQTHPFLWVGYAVSQGGTLSVTLLTNFSLRLKIVMVNQIGKGVLENKGGLTKCAYR